MVCAVCDADLHHDNEGCFIIITEVDYNIAIDEKRFCSFRCLKSWYDL